MSEELVSVQSSMTRRSALRALVASVGAAGRLGAQGDTTKHHGQHAQPETIEDSAGRRRTAESYRPPVIYFWAFVSLSLLMVAWTVYATVQERRVKLNRKRSQNPKSPSDAPRSLPRQRRRR